MRNAPVVSNGADRIRLRLTPGNWKHCFQLLERKAEPAFLQSEDVSRLGIEIRRISIPGSAELGDKGLEETGHKRFRIFPSVDQSTGR